MIPNGQCRGSQQWWVPWKWSIWSQGLSWAKLACDFWIVWWPQHASANTCHHMSLFRIVSWRTTTQKILVIYGDLVGFTGHLAKRKHARPEVWALSCHWCIMEVMLKWLLPRFHFKDGLRKVRGHSRLKLSGFKMCLRSEDYQYPECEWECSCQRVELFRLW